MKVSKIPGLGRFGQFIDGLDFDHLTDEEWLEIGQMHLAGLVTIIRNVNLTPRTYNLWMLKWGNPRNLAIYKVAKKYGTKDVREVLYSDEINGIPVAPEDKKWLLTVINMLADAGADAEILRVTGKKDDAGNPLGMFAEGELLWHSNESGNLVFTPGVSLLAAEGVVGSSTGFVTTADWYEKQTESFRSELDEMILCHKFTPGRINPGLRQDQDIVMYRNMCPEDNELPLVIKSPAGIKGLHYSVNTIHSIKGMSVEESQKVFDHINKGLFVDEYTYDHWYQNDNDLCLFDNSITLHRRLGGVTNRLCYRFQFDYGKLASTEQSPYYQEDYATRYVEQVKDINNVLKIKS